MLTRKDYQAIVIGGLIGALSCGIICGAGCDFVLPGECKSEGYLFGPCREGAESPAGCDFGLTCLEVPEGWMCVDLDGEVSPEEQECSQWVGPVACSEPLGLCWVTCIENGDADCVGGTVCDDRHKICVYPKAPDEPSETTTSTGGETTGAGTTEVWTGGETTGVQPSCGEPGGLFGSCIANVCADGLACFTAKSGGMCVPVYADETDPADDWSVNVCAGEIGRLGCRRDLGFCLVQCDIDGCDSGAVCDPYINYCVW